MAKISLEELTARSSKLGWEPDFIELVRRAKSPTAAFELATMKTVSLDIQKSCRYLAIIRRDYGEEAF